MLTKKKPDLEDKEKYKEKKEEQLIIPSFQITPIDFLVYFLFFFF